MALRAWRSALLVVRTAGRARPDAIAIASAVCVAFSVHGCERISALGGRGLGTTSCGRKFPGVPGTLAHILGPRSWRKLAAI